MGVQVEEAEGAGGREGEGERKRSAGEESRSRDPGPREGSVKRNIRPAEENFAKAGDRPPRPQQNKLFMRSIKMHLDCHA